MASLDDLAIRTAAEPDVDAVRDLFVKAYGNDYPFQEFYDTEWLKKSVFDDNTMFLSNGNAGPGVGGFDLFAWKSPSMKTISLSVLFRNPCGS